MTIVYIHYIFFPYFQFTLILEKFTDAPPTSLLDLKGERGVLKAPGLD